MYPDFPDLCAWGWVGTLCPGVHMTPPGEHRENCGCPGTPSFRHREDCRCYDPPVMREWHEKQCPMCSGTGKVQNFEEGKIK